MEYILSTNLSSGVFLIKSNASWYFFLSSKLKAWFKGVVGMKVQNLADLKDWRRYFIFEWIVQSKRSVKCLKYVYVNSLSGLRNNGFCLGSLTESVLEASRNVLDVSHTSSSLCSSALSLGTPVILSHLLGGVTAWCTGRFLDVKGPLPTSDTQNMCLGCSFTETRCTLSHASEIPIQSTDSQSRIFAWLSILRKLYGNCLIPKNKGPRILF